MKNGDEILLQAAKAAAAKLPELEARRAELSNELQTIALKITQYTAIISAAGLESSSALPAETSKRSAKGNCMNDIDSVLAFSPMTPKDIQEKILKARGTEYGISTIYANLQRGEKSGRYKNNHGWWSVVL